MGEEEVSYKKKKMCMWDCELPKDLLLRVRGREAGVGDVSWSFFRVSFGESAVLVCHLL